MPTPQKRQRAALCRYPEYQSYVTASVERAFANLPQWTLETRRDARQPGHFDLQWSDYDEIDWDSLKDSTMANSYVIRKGLIRKNHLAHTVALYLSKNPDSSLKRAVPRTYFFNLSFPDELDELLVDDLYEVAQSMEDNERKPEAERTWWILKAALADKGNGIRLFSTRDTLEAIFEEFDIDSDEESDEEHEDLGAQNGAAGAYGSGTRVDASQLREWVIQEYIARPLLVDQSSAVNGHGRKFHLRAYVVAAGGLTVYLHRPFLALFAPEPYESPMESEDGRINLTSHLTNTCLQTNLEEGPSELAVSTLPDLVGKTILSGPSRGSKLSTSQVHAVEDQVGEAVAEVFKAAVNAGTSFQPLPNAFEIFGCDFLVDETFNVSLLEINACPDFAQTGTELQGVIDHLFQETVDQVVLPFFRRQECSDGDLQGGQSESIDTTGANLASLSERDRGLRKILDMEVSKAW